MPLLPACEELVNHFYLGDPRGAKRVTSVEDIPFASGAEAALRDTTLFRVADSATEGSVKVEYAAYEMGNLYRVTCNFTRGQRPLLYVETLAQGIGGVKSELSRSRLLDAKGLP